MSAPPSPPWVPPPFPARLRTSRREIVAASLPPRDQAAWGRGGLPAPSRRAALARTERSPPGPEHVGVGLSPALGPYPTTETPAHLLTQILTKPRKSSRSWAASCRRRSAAWVRSSAPRHTRRPCINARRYCSTTVRSASASSSCGEHDQMVPGRFFHGRFPPFPAFPSKRTWTAGSRTCRKSWQKLAVRSHTSSSSSGLDSHRREGRAANRGWSGGQRRGWRDDSDPAFPAETPMHTLYLLFPPPSPSEASPVAPPAAPPTPGGRSSSATRPALPPPEPRPLEPPSRAAGRTRRSWTDQKYGFRTKAKAREALRCLATWAPPSGASVFREGARRAAPCTSESLGHRLRMGVVGSAS